VNRYISNWNRQRSVKVSAQNWEVEVYVPELQSSLIITQSSQDLLLCMEIVRNLPCLVPGGRPLRSAVCQSSVRQNPHAREARYKSRGAKRRALRTIYCSEMNHRMTRRKLTESFASFLFPVDV